MTRSEVTLDTDWLIPVAAGHAVSRGWTAATDHRPAGVTWHWTDTPDLAGCRAFLGGAHPSRKGEASAHYAVGRSIAEGIDQYVSLDDRSWHAGVNQDLRWDGRPLDRPDFKAARTCIGVETVSVGAERDGVVAGDDWLTVAAPDGTPLRVQPWTEEQVAMMIQVGRIIQARWPHLGPRDHHGHHDLCPRYKIDVTGFPFARVLRGIYDDDAIPDIWTPFWTGRGRQAALTHLGYAAAASAPGAGAGRGREALIRFQQDRGLVANGLWTTFVNWALYDVCAERGVAFDELCAHAG